MMDFDVDYLQVTWQSSVGLIKNNLFDSLPQNGKFTWINYILDFTISKILDNMPQKI